MKVWIFSIFFSVILINHVNAQEYIWAKNIQGGRNMARDINLDYQGNIFMTGGFVDTADFDMDSTSFILRGTPTHDVYIARYFADGSFSWAKNFGNLGYDFGKDCETDNYGNVVVMGRFEDTVDFDPSINVYNLVGSPQAVFFTKYDSSGNFIWAGSVNPRSNSEGDLDIDRANDIVLVGRFASTADFDPDTAVSYSLISIGRSGYVVKYDQNMKLKWAKEN